MHPPKPWYLYVDRKRRHTLLRILAELSLHQDKKDPNFILVGALSLLVQGRLNYTAFWDVDLLFKSRLNLENFLKVEKSRDLKIVHYDTELQEGAQIRSFHTLWCYDKVWFNVDCILRPPFFNFHYSTIKDRPYSEEATIDNRHYNINLLIAHPWDILVEKLLSPRLEQEVSLTDSFSVDARHIFVIFSQDKDNPHFWTHMGKKAMELGKRAEIRRSLLGLLSAAKGLGYDVELTDRILKRIEEL